MAKFFFGFITFVFFSQQLNADLLEEIKISPPVKKVKKQEKKTEDKSPKIKKSSSSASKSNPRPSAQASEPITFSSLGFSGFRSKGTMELHKNVQVNQGDFELKSDNAKIYFEVTTDKIKLIEAKGNIRVEKIDPKSLELIQAFSNTATFDANRQVISLKGNAILKKGDDTIKGEQIKYDMTSGLVEADKVQGVVIPSGKEGEKQ